MAFKALKGKASKVGGWGAGPQFADNLAQSDASAPINGDVAQLSLKGRGHKYGRSVQDPGGPAEGRGSFFARTNRKTKGGANVKGGVF